MCSSLRFILHCHVSPDPHPKYLMMIHRHLQYDKSYEMHELGHGPNFFGRPSIAQRVASEIFIFFYIFNFDVIFFMHH
jgi:hypothetical protein